MIKIKLTESQLTDVFKKIINESQEKIDAILDKINRVGLENLSKKEREFLDYHATTGDYLDDEELITSSDRVPSGETWIFDGLPGIPKMEFQYETTEENIDEIIHTGYLSVNNDPFYGEIYCDNKGNYSLCNFESDESVNLFETYEGLEHEIESFLSIVCNDLKGDLMT
jgi:type IV secretory pathway VirB4 component